MDFQLTDEQFSKILADSHSRIEEAMLESIRDRLSWTVAIILKEELEPVVREFCKTEVVPEIAEQLAGSKSEIVTAVVGQAQIIGTEFARGLALSVAEKMGNGYQRRDLFKALFG